MWSVKDGGRGVHSAGLLADHVDRHALGSELGVVGVPQPIHVHALFDPGLGRPALKHGPDVLAG